MHTHTIQGIHRNKHTIDTSEKTCIPERETWNSKLSSLQHDATEYGITSCTVRNPENAPGIIAMSSSIQTVSPCPYTVRVHAVRQSADTAFQEALLSVP